TLAPYFDAAHYRAGLEAAGGGLADALAQASGVDLADHYLASVWREGRVPAPRFDTLAYCLTPAITYATQNPLVRCVLTGGPARPDREAGLALRFATLAPYFDAAHYRAGLEAAGGGLADALAQASGVDLADHYLASVWREGR
ncbi:hypothetical protein MKK88_22085, partial [Methylobacterium sp. E-005]|nr:hypothetical protein [Methylobacterium sp. E-005]